MCTSSSPSWTVYPGCYQDRSLQSGNVGALHKDYPLELWGPSSYNTLLEAEFYVSESDESVTEKGVELN